MGHRLAPLFAASLLAGILFAGPGFADDASDIKTAISSQLDAFKAGDKTAAYSYAAPSIKAIFPSPDIFMTMVRQGYPQVYDARSVIFGSPTAEGKGFRQEVYLTDKDGQSWIASYTLEREDDGSMKITGVTIRKGSDVAA